MARFGPSDGTWGNCAPAKTPYTEAFAILHHEI
jgi:hypothetical protein